MSTANICAQAGQAALTVVTAGEGVGVGSASCTAEVVMPPVGASASEVAGTLERVEAVRRCSLLVA